MREVFESCLRGNRNRSPIKTPSVFTWVFLGRTVGKSVTYPSSNQGSRTNGVPTRTGEDLFRVVSDLSERQGRGGGTGFPDQGLPGTLGPDLVKFKDRSFYTERNGPRSYIINPTSLVETGQCRPDSSNSGFEGKGRGIRG